MTEENYKKLADEQLDDASGGLAEFFTGQMMVTVITPACDMWVGNGNYDMHKAITDHKVCGNCANMGMANGWSICKVRKG